MPATTVRSVKELRALSLEDFLQLRKEAEAKNADPTKQSELARCYEVSTPHLAENSKQAFDLYTHAAQQGYGFAQAKVALFYWFGIGVKKDEEHALALFKLAAEDQGSLEAQEILVEFFMIGTYVPRDYPLAKKYAELAVKQQGVSRDIQNLLGCILEHGLDGSPLNQKRAIELYTLSAERGGINAQLNLARCYSGRSVLKDIPLARRYHTLAANQGNIEAQKILAAYYERGGYDVNDGLVRPDIETALIYHTRAARQGDLESQLKLARWYEYGLRLKNHGQEDETVVCQDKKCAVEFYRLAAAQGDLWAQATLGWHYETGFGVQEDRKQSEAFYEQALAQWHKTEVVKLSLLIEVENNEEKCIAFLKKIIAHNKVCALIISEDRIREKSEQLKLGEVGLNSDSSLEERETRRDALNEISRANTSIALLDLSAVTTLNLPLHSLLPGFRNHSALKTLKLPKTPILNWWIGSLCLLQGETRDLNLELTLPSSDYSRDFLRLTANFFQAIQQSSLVSLTVHTNFESKRITDCIGAALRGENNTIKSLTLCQQGKINAPGPSPEGLTTGAFWTIFSQFPNLHSFTVTGVRLSLMKGGLTSLLLSLHEVKALKELVVEQIDWSSMDILPLISLLEKHANSLSVLKLFSLGYLERDTLQPEQVEPLMEGIIGLPQLTTLRLDAFFFGPPEYKTGFDILSSFITRKECVLRELDFSVIRWTPLYERIFSPAFQARKKIMLERNQSNQHNWMQAGFLISCMRANQGSRIATSVFPLIPVVTRMAQG